MSRRIVIAVLAAFSAACGDAASKAERFLTAGDEYYGEGRYYAAAIEYRNAIKQVPESSTAHRKLGLAHLAAGDAGAAYRAFTRAVDLDPADVEPRLEAGRLLLRAGMYDLAHVRAEQVLERDPENLDAQIVAGRSLAELRRTDEALAQLSLAAVTTKDARAYVAIGEIKQRAGDVAGAENAYREAIALSPDLVEPRTMFAALLLDLGRPGEAEAQLVEAQRAAPDDELANRALAALYLATDRPDMAETALIRAAQQPVQKHHSSLALADFYGSLGRFDDAKAALNQIARTESNDANAAQVRLAALEYASGARDEGRRLLARVLKRQPTPEALELEARFDEAEGRADPE
jgi:tetratricopeptide (TPR) repeat protein